MAVDQDYKDAMGAIRANDLRQLARLLTSGRVAANAVFKEPIGPDESIESTLVLYAAAEGSPAAMRALLRVGGDVNLAFGEISPIARALIAENLGAVKVLLDAGADPNAAFRDAPILHLAVDASSFPMVSTLLRAGADPNGRDLHGRTPLYVLAAAARGDLVDEREFRKIARELRRYGADPDVPDSAGRRPVDVLGRASLRKDLSSS